MTSVLYQSHCIHYNLQCKERLYYINVSTPAFWHCLTTIYSDTLIQQSP